MGWHSLNGVISSKANAVYNAFSLSKHIHGVIFLRVQSQGVLRKNQRVNALNPPRGHLVGKRLRFAAQFCGLSYIGVGLRINGIRLDTNLTDFL